MDNYHKILQKYWGYEAFRPLQHDIIQSVGQGHDTLALMPTGGGKSITFQVPILAEEGMGLVITPLIALMRDQVENLNKRNIQATAIYSGMTKTEIETALNKSIYGKMKFLYISPERLSTELFKAKLEHLNVNLIAVDEAHCISQWGYDFRPSYLKISQIRDFFPNTPVLAVTATATPDVTKDIQYQLNFKKKNLLQKSFERKNLLYLVRKIEDKPRYLINTLSKFKGSGIIYVRNRKKCKEIAQYLRQNNISADYYHAGLSTEVRNQKQQFWIEEKYRVMVATNAFGMGIDKPNVRFVIHYDLPDNIESYFQEAGRAGRDEKQSYAVLLYNNADKIRAKQRILTKFPEITTIKKVYQALGNYLQIPYGGGKYTSYIFNIGKFAKHYSFSITTVYNSLKLLEKEGYVELTDAFNNPSKLYFTIERDDLYKFQVSNPDFDDFIKLLLRSYSGLFTDYVSIDEDYLARKSNTKIETVYEYLKKLQQVKLINYIPRRNSPLIVYNEERLEEKNIVFSKINYKDRKEQYIKRIHAMLQYATDDTVCRSQQLLYYFGEKNTEKCGMCDVCKKHQELDLEPEEYLNITRNIKHMLTQNPVSIDKLIYEIDVSKEKGIKIIQWLLDNDKIRYNQDKKLRWYKD